MLTWHKILLIAVITLLLACASGCERDSNEPNTGIVDTQRDDAHKSQSYLELGKETYERSCASCHDESSDSGAPVTGDPDSWANRSQLWSAVLLEHAKQGYLGMPARGGDPELSDRAVEAAGEYMLGETFPELPID